jgi:hypothetical protein
MKVDYAIIGGGIVRGINSSYFCNAPSPAATASVEIGKAAASEVLQGRSTVMKSVAGLETVSGGGRAQC